MFDKAEDLINTKVDDTKDSHRDPDIIGSEIAMRRAAKRARQVARQNNSYVVIYRDGEIVKEKVEGSKSDLED